MTGVQTCALPISLRPGLHTCYNGAYKKGNNPALDNAVSKIDQINGFLEQGIDESFTYEETLELMQSIVG